MSEQPYREPPKKDPCDVCGDPDTTTEIDSVELCAGCMRVIDQQTTQKQVDALVQNYPGLRDRQALKQKRKGTQGAEPR